MMSIRHLTRVVFCFTAATGVLTPQHSFAMNSDNKQKLMLLGGFAGGIAACLFGQYLWQRICPKTPEQKLGLPKNAFIGYYGRMVTRNNKWDNDTSAQGKCMKIQDDDMFERSKFMVDTTNNITYLSYQKWDKVSHAGSEFTINFTNYSYIFDINANKVHKKTSDKTELCWEYKGGEL